jgi:hypothetical protein
MKRGRPRNRVQWTPLLLTAMLLAGTGTAIAAPCCAADTEPRFQLGLAALEARIGDVMGEPIECEHGNSDNGDTLQQTTTGLAYYRRSTNTAAFTDGDRHWAIGVSEVLTWEGPAVDPPANAGLAAAVLPAQRLVAFYGNPRSPVLGVLGEPPVETMLARLRDQADAYAASDPARPVQPALELIAVLAQGSPGSDGLYRFRMPAAEIDQVAEWAEDNGFLLILDVQAGRADVLDEVVYLLPWLRRPYVHLALDPEFAMRPDQPPPGHGIGSLDSAVINASIDVLADAAREQALPPKVLIVHRFLETMVTDYRAIAPDPLVQVVIDMDGFGGRTAKLSKYADLVRDQPVQFAGIKLFYDYDTALLDVADVLRLDPPPDLVIYQ